jgi:2-polyprenyl-3-methyl-5-hydroxy-6-metoxy-1,4-benzoquinol methylase
MAEGIYCRSCGNKIDNLSLLRLPDMPKAVQNLPADKSEAMASGVVLDLRQCQACGLVQLSNSPVPYFKDVVRAGSFSPSMRARQFDEFKTFIERFSLQGKSVLEIGSGRGEYLSILNDLPVAAYGMEHNVEYCEHANERGLKTFQGYPVDMSAPPAGILFDAFICINFLEHVPQPGVFLRSCANLISETGIGMVAVPDLEFELRDNYLFSFMSDHLCYFSSNSLRNTLVLNGFDIIDLFRNDKLNVVTAYFRRQRPFDLSASTAKYDNFRKTINGYIDSITDADGRVAVWGASHLAFSVISACAIGGKISYIVDSATYKQGRFAPVSALQIYPPSHLTEAPVSAIIVFAPEYSSEIVHDIKAKYSHVVQRIATFKNGVLEVIS